MKKKIGLALVVLLLAQALAACTQNQAAGQENGFRFLQAERIRQADLDYIHKQGVYMSEDAADYFDDTMCLYVLVLIRTMTWEAAEQGLGISREEARALAEEHYAEAEAAGRAGKSTGEEVYQQLEYWQWLQDYMQRADMSPEEWYEYNGVTIQFEAAYKPLYEQVVAELPPEQQADPWAQGAAWTAYQLELTEKYKDRLVEEDLQPLLETTMEKMAEGTIGTVDSSTGTGQGNS